MSKMSLWNWLTTSSGNRPKPAPKTPLLPESTDDVECSAAAQIDAVVIENADSKPIGKRRGSYFDYDDELRTKISKHACLHGQRSASRYFSKELGRTVAPSTVASITKKYKQHLVSAPSGENFTKSDRGRPLMLPNQADSRVQSYVRAIRKTGGVVNTSIVLATAIGVAQQTAPQVLESNGGWLGFSSRAWGKSLLKRKGTKSALKVPDNIGELRDRFTGMIQNTMEQHNIPPELVVNFDETAIAIVPASSWSMASCGSKQVPLTGLDDKRQITAVLGCSMAGEFLPAQLLYEGSTNRCHPSVKFPDGYDIWHSPNHWCNESTMLRYVEKVLVPFFNKQRTKLQLDAATPGLVIMDVFRAHRTPAVMDILDTNNCKCVFVPANCTSEMQVMDLVVNKIVKDAMKNKFIEWYSRQVVDDINDTEDRTGETCEVVSKFKPDLKLSTLKPLHAEWLIDVLVSVSARHDVFLKGWEMAMRKHQPSAASTQPGGNEVNACQPVEATDHEADPIAQEDESCSQIQDEGHITINKASSSLATELLPPSPPSPMTDDTGGAASKSASKLPIPTESFKHAIWQVTKVHEWYLPLPLSQSTLDGRTSSLACTIISAEIARAVLQDPSLVPTSADSPPSSAVEPFLAAIRSGNQRYDAGNCVGLLGIDTLLDLFPDLGLALSPKRDFGFFNRQHVERNLPKIIEFMMLSKSASFAALFIHTPYTVAICFVYGRLVIFDSHRHGKNGALIAIAGNHLSPGLAAVYIGSYIERIFSLRSRVAGCQLSFIELA
eukprot:scpid48499/ scgid26512/ Pogo transposable element with KRAB domain